MAINIFYSIIYLLKQTSPRLQLWKQRDTQTEREIHDDEKIKRVNKL